MERSYASVKQLKTFDKKQRISFSVFCSFGASLGDSRSACCTSPERGKYSSVGQRPTELNGKQNLALQGRNHLYFRLTA